MNNFSPVESSISNFTSSHLTLKDSIAFSGRTPCNIPGVISQGQDCYKLKWIIILYADAGNNKNGTYKILGTPYRSEGGRIGTWKIITGKDGGITYLLNDNKGNPMLRLLKIDDNIIMFTDFAGRLLTGNEDFSYTLNKR